MKRTFIGIVTFILIVAISSISFAASSGTINTDTARMRSSASSSASVIELISMGEEVEITGEDGDWYKVKYNGQTGYISKSLIDTEKSNQTSTNKTTNTTTNATTNEQVQETNEIANTTTNEQAQEITTDNKATVVISEAYVGNLQSEVTIKIMPAFNSTDIAKIEAGTQITVVEIINDWCRIDSGTYIGWARLNLIQESISEPSATEAEQEEETEEVAEETGTTVGYVNATSVNIRKEANASSDIVDKLTINTEVTILEEIDGWYKIQVGDITGYVSAQYISDEKVADTTSRAADTARAIEEAKGSTDVVSTSSSSTGASVVAYAKQFLGSKYVRGGSSPSTGFDCSGFTSYVYKNFGVSLSRTSSGQRSNGTQVSKSDLQAGDIVCFSGHVGIYIGNNQFIHACCGTHGVIISSLSENYYAQSYITARRVL